MCFPPAVLAAFALTGVGGGLKYMGEKKAANAQEKVNMAERVRQKAMTDQQQVAFEDSLAKAGDVAGPQAMQAAADKREEFLRTAVTPSTDLQNYLPGNQSAPQIIADARTASVAKEKASAGGLAAALAALGGTTDQMQNLNIGVGRNAQKIGQVARDKAGSADILGADLKAASFKGGTLRGLGQLAQMIGRAVSMGSAAGMFAPSSAVAAGQTASAVGSNAASMGAAPGFLKFAPTGLY